MWKTDVNDILQTKWIKDSACKCTPVFILEITWKNLKYLRKLQHIHQIIQIQNLNIIIFAIQIT